MSEEFKNKIVIAKSFWKVFIPYKSFDLLFTMDDLQDPETKERIRRMHDDAQEFVIFERVFQWQKQQIYCSNLALKERIRLECLLQGIHLQDDELDPRSEVLCMEDP